MAFVHGVALDFFMSQSAEHPDAAHAENGFLHQPIALIAAIKKMGERPIRWRVVRKIDIQKINRHAETARPDHFVFPRPYHHGSTFDGDARSLRQLCQNRSLPNPRVLRRDGHYDRAADRSSLYDGVALSLPSELSNPRRHGSYRRPARQDRRY